MNIEYKIITSRRKTCSIEIKNDLSIIVRAPLFMPKYKINAFVKSKEKWIIANLQRIKAKKEKINELSVITPDEIERLKVKAKEYIPKRVKYYADIMGISYNKITIRCQKSRWGSCSSKKNLNFNCLLMLTPDDVIDYVIVHELCHIKQMNHSKAFWQEVEKVLPSYKGSYDWLKENGSLIIGRVKSVFS